MWTARKVLGLLLLLLGSWVGHTVGTCNVCNSVNSMACYSMNQVQACDANNLPTLRPYDCPAGYVCVSGRQGVLCRPAISASGQADCQQCNKCDASRTFACTDTTSFSLCLGTDMPQNSRGTCAEGYVCNNNNSTQICRLATAVAPTCSYADDTTTTTTTSTTTAAPTTPSPQGDPTAYCAAVQQQGRFAVGPDAASTCRQYIHCRLLNDQWLGQRYTCPGSTFFDARANLCVTSMPETCSYHPSTTTSTTPAPTVDNPAAWCAAMQSQDTYPVGTNPSTTCRQYVYCFLLDGEWLGQMYTCPGSTYYNSAMKRCVPALPATCSASIASLSLNGVELQLD
ncbi:uncharacterized protein LOC108598263 [Drosophila busckii]|nr:uncharacterized protein LOC108598263 [Drosophila busckii]